MRRKDVLGRHGEDLAVAYLERLGLTILDRNWRCPAGELDIVASDGPCLVVCEVKTRSTARYGSPLEAVGPRKVRRLRQLAVRWLEERGVHVPQIRFDVVGVLQREADPPVIQHVKGI